MPQLLALSDAPQVRWSRTTERWRPCHDLALAVLRGLWRDMRAGSSESFVFLLDMYALFECYCQRWIEERFEGVQVRDQVPLGSLLVAPSRRLNQYADFLWRERNGMLWVGDAKYKINGGDEWPKIADTRQLICYGQLAAILHASKASALMLLYPTTGEEISETMTTYDGQSLLLQAVRVVA